MYLWQPPLCCAFCFSSTANDSLWTINLLHAYPFSAGAAGSVIFLSLLTMTAAHLSPSSQQLLIFSSRLTEWRRQSRKGQTASPRRSALRKSTSSHRWDKLLGTSHEVALGCFFTPRFTKSLQRMCPLFVEVIYWVESPNSHTFQLKRVLIMSPWVLWNCDGSAATPAALWGCSRTHSSALSLTSPW